MDDVAMHIAENLHHDMAWADDPFFEQHMCLADTGRCLTLAGLQGVRQIFGPIDPAHPLTSAPCDSFDKDCITDDARGSEEHTPEPPSLLRSSLPVLQLKQKKTT